VNGILLIILSSNVLNRWKETDQDYMIVLRTDGDFLDEYRDNNSKYCSVKDAIAIISVCPSEIGGHL
jgi:hypothetical protein